MVELSLDACYRTSVTSSPKGGIEKKPSILVCLSNMHLKENKDEVSHLIVTSVIIINATLYFSKSFLDSHKRIKSVPMNDTWGY